MPGFGVGVGFGRGVGFAVGSAVGAATSGVRAGDTAGLATVAARGGGVGEAATATGGVGESPMAAIATLEATRIATRPSSIAARGVRDTRRGVCGVASRSDQQAVHFGANGKLAAPQCEQTRGGRSSSSMGTTRSYCCTSASTPAPASRNRCVAAPLVTGS